MNAQIHVQGPGIPVCIRNLELIATRPSPRKKLAAITLISGHFVLFG